MKKITFKKLRLLNFCGIREAEYKFGDTVTTISGRNGIGKSSIFNAITYALFGTDQYGNALDIKTYDSEHHIIPEIPHEVELLVAVDSEDVLVKRTLSDIWKGEAVKNTYKYYINGQVCTAADFKKAIDGICNEQVFRLASSSTEFIQQPWVEQRKFLQTIAGDYDVASITETDSKYDFIADALKKQDIETTIHHLKYRRSELQKELEEIPIRLVELNKALPEAVDWTKLAEDKEKINTELLKVNADILQVKTGSADNVYRNTIQRNLDFANRRKREMEKSASNLASNEHAKHESDLITARTAESKTHAVVTELQSKMSGYTDTEVHARQQKEDCEQQVKELNEKNAELSLRSWKWSNEDSFCPHCLQPLPVDKLQKMREESEKRFNENVANERKALMDDFAKLQKTYTELKQLLEQVDEDRKITSNQLVNALAVHKEAEKHLEVVKSEQPVLYEDILAAKQEYKQVCQEIAGYEQQLEQPVVTDDQSKILDELKSKQKEYTEKVSDINMKLASKETYYRILDLIEDVKDVKRSCQEHIDELSEKIDVASEYYQQSCRILEDKVNEHFGFVKWSLFKSNLDGEKKPFCECYHDGVPYSRLNGAAKVNAGIDIAYTIAEHYGVSVPIVLDECESILSPIYRGGQQIRLRVSNDESLKFEYEDRDQI